MQMYVSLVHNLTHPRPHPLLPYHSVALTALDAAIHLAAVSIDSVRLFGSHSEQDSHITLDTVTVTEHC
jgi:hypothetical protein